MVRCWLANDVTWAVVTRLNHYRSRRKQEIALTRLSASASDAHATHFVAFKTEMIMNARLKRPAPVRQVDASCFLDLALRCARNLYRASNRRMPEARALAIWLRQAASTFGLIDAAIPDYEVPLRNKRNGVSVRDWHKSVPYMWFVPALSTAFGTLIRCARSAWRDSPAYREVLRRSSFKAAISSGPNRCIASAADMIFLCAAARFFRAGAVPRRDPASRPTHAMT